MHRTARIVPIVTLITAGTLLAPNPARAAIRDPNPISRQAADTRTEQRDVQRYWTAAKMRTARPFDDLTPDRDGIRLNLATGAPARTGTPSAIAPTRPSLESATATAPNSQGAPWTARGVIAQTIGRVFFTYQGRNASCSGNAVTSANKSVVITAGHCVRMGGAFHDNWIFVPGYDRGDRPFGTWVATSLLTTPRWSSGEDIGQDMGAAVVAPLDGRRLTDVVGGQGIAFNQPRRRQMYAFGYPGGDPYDGSRLIYCSGRTIDDPMSTRDSGLRCNMTGGSSGGPWLLGFAESTGLGTQNSVNSFKYNVAPAWMFGPYFGPEVKAVYEAASRAGAT